MNKSLYFVLGALFGAAGGSVATYMVTKEMFAMQAAEEIEAYSEHCEERIARIKSDHNKVIFEEVRDKMTQLTNDPEEQKIESNEGVKKYHHNSGLDSGYGANHIFEKLAEGVEEAKKDSKLVNDIDEDEFMNSENGYDKQTIDVMLGDDKYMCGIWGMGTDNEDDVDRKWGKDLEDLIGRSHTYDELLSICGEDGLGHMFVKNDELMIDFELIIHDGREEDK